jgi:aldehyde dehydrogenase (NAD+)
MASRATAYVDKIEGSVVPVFPNRGFDYVLPEPYGVVAALSAWKGHSGLLQRTVADMAAGNCVIVKPSEDSPFAALRYGEIALEAGLPPGVFSVVPGGAEAGRALVEHPGVDRVTLTGGRTTAQLVMGAAASTLKPFCSSLEASRRA